MTLSGVRSEFPGLGYDNFHRFVALVYHQPGLKESNCQVVAPLERGESCSFVKCIPNQYGVSESDPRIGSTRHDDNDAITEMAPAATATEQSWQSKVIRLDYNYPPAPGDIDFPGSYDYDVPHCFIGTRIELQ